MSTATKSVIRTVDTHAQYNQNFSKYHMPVDYRDTWRIFRIMAEFVDGYQFLGQFQQTVTFFGSARTPEGTFPYEEARKAARLLGKSGFSIITGGGPGVMEGANRGAREAKAQSIGLNIQLPREQIINPYVDRAQGFHYFFSRKVMLTSPAQAGLFFPGGFGTMDEFFEILDLIQIGKMRAIPVIAVGRDYWDPLVKFLQESSWQDIGAISEINLSSFKVVSSAEEAAAQVKKMPTKKKLCNPAVDDWCGDAINWKIFRIMAELVEGFEFLSKEVRNDVTILGTKSIAPGSPYYQASYEVAKALGKKGYSIVTGGGPGIMEAANKGAVDAGAPSIGLNMRSDYAVRANPYVRKSVSFFFPFTRKLILTMPSLGFVFFPGGYGTLHQLFEVLTLMETGKMGKMSIVLYGKKFWTPLDKLINEMFYKKYKTVNKADVELYTIVDSVEEALQYIPRRETEKYPFVKES